MFDSVTQAQLGDLPMEDQEEDDEESDDEEEEAVGNPNRHIEEIKQSTPFIEERKQRSKPCLFQVLDLPYQAQIEETKTPAEKSDSD